MENPYLGTRNSGLVRFLVFTNPQVRGADPPDDTTGIIRRAVVDNDEFKIRAFLYENGADRAGQDRSAIISWDNDADQGHEGL